MNSVRLHAAGLLSCLAIAQAGCAQPIDLCTDEAAACLTVQVVAESDQPGAATTAIDRLRVLYTVGGENQPERQFAGPEPAGSLLPLAFQLKLPASGAVHVDVIAEKALSPVLSGSTEATLADNEHQQASVALGATVKDFPFQGPPPRHHGGMVYFPPRQSIVLFGGVARDGTYLEDTWELDLATSTWSSRPGSGPPPRMATLSYDPVLKRVVLVGGTSPAGQPSLDLWSYDTAGTWTPEPGNRGGGSRTSAGVTVTDTGVAVVYGGVDPTGTVLQDVVSFDPATRSGPDFLNHPTLPATVRVKSPRLVATSVPVPGSVFLLGTDLNNLSSGLGVWQLSAGNYSVANTIVVISPIVVGDPSSPTRRTDYAVAADSAAGLIYVFGGAAESNGQLLQDAYVFSVTTKQWTRISTAVSPLPRAGAQLAWQPSALLLLGGAATATSPAAIALDTWNLTVSPFATPTLDGVFTRRP